LGLPQLDYDSGQSTNNRYERDEFRKVLPARNLHVIGGAYALSPLS
jgi:hypothetical protein